MIKTITSTMNNSTLEENIKKAFNSLSKEELEKLISAKLKEKEQKHEEDTKKFYDLIVSGMGIDKERNYFTRPEIEILVTRMITKDKEPETASKQLFQKDVVGLLLEKIPNEVQKEELKNYFTKDIIEDTMDKAVLKNYGETMFLEYKKKRAEMDKEDAKQEIEKEFRNIGSKKSKKPQETPATTETKEDL